MSMNGFNQAFLLNLITLRNFCNTNPLYSACFYSSYACKVILLTIQTAQKFFELSNFIHSIKKSKSL